ncbi:MAG TPA: tRNA (N6-threonylcarbamoyladenosine(37)-N6)-methyltransferase TrmO [Draconibacterium sp.]|nr:tRNA (N6-threonylcarbamoyladenosine(37)-N6)-methyltransferase TrmO [Draconibacterium sp.]
MHTVELTIIGSIRTQHQFVDNMPIQSAGAEDEPGVIELYPEYQEGLFDLEDFSHLILIYHFHKQYGFSLKVKPFMDDKEHGVFATRSPKHPAAVGVSIVRLLRIEGNKIYFEGADMLDKTPLIDIKPFFRNFDNRLDAVSGWLDSKDEKQIKKVRSDDRFK